MAKNYKRKYTKAILRDKKGGFWFLYLDYIDEYTYEYQESQKRQGEEFVRVIRGEEKEALIQARQIARERGIIKDIVIHTVAVM